MPVPVCRSQRRSLGRCNVPGLREFARSRHRRDHRRRSGKRPCLLMAEAPVAALEVVAELVPVRAVVWDVIQLRADQAARLCRRDPPGVLAQTIGLVTISPAALVSMRGSESGTPKSASDRSYGGLSAYASPWVCQYCQNGSCVIACPVSAKKCGVVGSTCGKLCQSCPNA